VGRLFRRICKYGSFHQPTYSRFYSKTKLLVKIGNLWYYIVMDQLIEKTTARRVGDSLYFRIPLNYWRKHNLKPGDAFFWIPKEGAVILKRITPEIVAELSDEVKPVAGV